MGSRCDWHCDWGMPLGWAFAEEGGMGARLAAPGLQGFAAVRGQTFLGKGIRANTCASDCHGCEASGMFSLSAGE